MNEQSATRLVGAPLQRIRSILLTPTALPQWNPAFRSVSGPATVQVGHRYALTALAGLRGHLAYTSIGQHEITAHIEVPGMREDGWWRLTAPQDESPRGEPGFRGGGGREARGAWPAGGTSR